MRAAELQPILEMQGTNHGQDRVPRDHGLSPLLIMGRWRRGEIARTRAALGGPGLWLAHSFSLSSHRARLRDGFHSG